MNDIAIKVENLSKRYRIGLKEHIPDTFVGAMTGWLKAPLDNFRQLRRLSHFSDNGHDRSTVLTTDPDDIFWALKDVSFEIRQGEVVGIIGRNGAGKSTLLKILSRIVEPTAGRAIINGRVSSLLEVGTGFHPDLTGRENVYLNGTILGMTKAEIERKFDEIVDFSGVEKFIDTPVKRYSSGMQVRLAFAVAAHLEPEILLVDEVLAVGDAEFQKKCLGKMGEVVERGRTVLFVSHNMGVIRNLCKQVFVINNGKLIFNGSSAIGVGKYLELLFDENNNTTDASVIKFEQPLINGVETSSIYSGASFSLEVLMHLSIPIMGFRLFCILENIRGDLIIHAYKTNGELKIDSLNPGIYRVLLEFPPIWLTAGVYSLHFKIIANAVGKRQLRFFSDKFPIDVIGQSEDTGKAICMPNIVWDLTCHE